jgi:hypothetical protein
MRAMNIETCYMCRAPATSREHAPPKCLFPESKDVEDGADLRKNLITVPSCTDHNLTLSKDDEYFLVITTANIGGNQCRSQQLSTKVVRALRRNPVFADNTFAARLPMATVDGQPAIGFKIDRARIERVVEKTARAIWFHSASSKLLVPVSVLLPMLRSDDGTPGAYMEGLGEHAAAMGAGMPWLGDNPEVFRYRLRIDPTDGFSFLWMSFYDGFVGFVSWGSRVPTSVAG